MQKEKMVERLVKLKALAERGVGGEKETALRMFAELKEKHGISDKEIETAAGLTQGAAGDEKEYSDILFALYILANNLDEEMRICRECPLYGLRGACTDCGTDKNIKDLQKQYEDLKQNFERGCASA